MRTGSNYLAPDNGLLSTDTPHKPAIYVRFYRNDTRKWYEYHKVYVVAHLVLLYSNGVVWSYAVIECVRPSVEKRYREQRAVTQLRQFFLHISVDKLGFLANFYSNRKRH